MISLVLVLFFGLTGITLNHPAWTFGDDAERTSFDGMLPDGAIGADGTVDFLAISEFVRDEFDIGGSVTDHFVDDNDGTISYKAPGYAADVFFEVDSGAYEVVVEQQGFVAVMNDLHKGRDAPSSWKWVIDIAAGVLVLVSLTGLGIQIFQRKRRTRALASAAGGLVVAIVLVVVALG